MDRTPLHLTGHDRRVRRRRGVVLLALVVALVSCGDAGDPPSATDTPDGTDSPSETDTPSATDTPVETVQVWFSTGDGSDCGAVEPFERPLPAGADPLEHALAELVAGPTDAEVAAGAGSFFTEATTGAVLQVARDDGLVVVDLVDVRPLMSGASTSCGSEALLATLHATVFQVDDVERVRFTIEGSCDAFANWLQRACFDLDRDGEQLDVPGGGQALAHRRDDGR